MKRLCIYLTYDKQNIIDKYIGYMLKELRSCCDSLIAVCNGMEISRSTDTLKQYADEIFYRRNLGFDAGGFKDAICKLIGWNEVLKYDELLLVNDSFFGPFRPMRSIFLEMDRRPLDFWGLAKHGAVVRNGILVFPEHIQSFFINIRSALLHSAAFKEYWQNLPYFDRFCDVVSLHEVKFTAYFSDLGYTYGVLADMEANDSEINYANNYSQYAVISYELIQKRNFPFLKKQQIAYDTLNQQTQENLRQAIDYIDRETNYDVNLIWDNIIRTLNMTDLQRSLHFQYIVPVMERAGVTKRNIAIVIFAQHRDAIEYVREYLGKLGPEWEYPIHVISDDNDILNSYRECTRNKNVIAVKEKCDWTELYRYDYVCILHDTDMTSDIVPSCTGKSCFFCIWENLFKDESHIWGVLEQFEREKRLGFLAPPQPNFADYFGELACGWDGKYEIIEGILKRLGISCPLSETKPPFRVSDSFWIRGSILRHLNGLEPREYLYLPYLWISFAQDMGFYSGIIESAEYASMNEVNMQYYLSQIANQVKSIYGEFGTFDEMREKIQADALSVFCKNHSRVLIYGTGYYAEKYYGMISNIEACIISDGQRRMHDFKGIPVRYLSEIENIDEYGIVLCMNGENQRQVIPLIRERGIEDYFCIS